MQQLTQLVQQAKDEIKKASSLDEIELLRVSLLGKKGSITTLLKEMKNLPKADIPEIGKAINLAKQQVQAWLEEKKVTLVELKVQQQLDAGTLDVTLPGQQRPLGSIHPISKTITRMLAIFSKLGFNVAYGPEIETEYYNFEALNIPEHHPARTMHDTFFFPDGKVLRTHTSPVQIRVMEQTNPPIQIVVPGRVYRCDFDLTHTPMFHQIEGLVVNEDVSFADLKSVLHNFLTEFFGKELSLRLRPSYFPFTEPSVEVDISCVNCNGTGCRVCKQTGWLEVLGAGMVHPNVLKYGKQPGKYRGFAFGMGVERLAMLYYGINDLRVFFENDVRFLKQFDAL